MSPPLTRPLCGRHLWMCIWRTNEPTPKAWLWRRPSIQRPGLWANVMARSVHVTSSLWHWALSYPNSQRQRRDGNPLLPPDWAESIEAYLALAVDRLADYGSAVCSWHNSGEKNAEHVRWFALPIVWDFTEVDVGSDTSGGYLGAIEWISLFLTRTLAAVTVSLYPRSSQRAPRRRSRSGST